MVRTARAPVAHLSGPLPLVQHAESGLLHSIRLGIGLGLEIPLELFPSRLWLGGVSVIDANAPRELDPIVASTDVVTDP
jgi:hypothetical protein